MKFFREIVQRASWASIAVVLAALTAPSDALGQAFVPQGNTTPIQTQGQSPRTQAIQRGVAPAGAQGVPLPGRGGAQSIIPRRRLQYNDNPNVPGLSREERIRRQESLIRNRRRSRVVQGLPDDLENRAANARLNVMRELRKQAFDKLGNDIRRGIVASLEIDEPVEEVVQEDEETHEYKPIFIYLNADPYVVLLGEHFKTECGYTNLSEVKLDRVELLISYDPEIIKPVSIHQNRIADLLAEPPQWGIDADAGEIHYRAQFSEPQAGLSMKLIDVVWEALRPAEDLVIALWTENEQSSAHWGPRLMTENEFGERGVLMATRVTILEPIGPMPAGPRILSAGRDEAAGFSSDGFVDSAVAPRFRIDASVEDFYEAGQWVVFDVTLENPDDAEFDEICLELEFDPRFIQFSDADRGNLLKTGVNVLDGPFRDRWSWDMIYSNEIDNRRGRVRYRVGRRHEGPTSSALVARLIGQTLRPSAGPLLRWVDGGNNGAQRTTGIYLRGRNLMAGADGSTPGSSDVAARTPRAEKADPALYTD